MKDEPLELWELEQAINAIQKALLCAYTFPTDENKRIAQREIRDRGFIVKKIQQ